MIEEEVAENTGDDETPVRDRLDELLLVHEERGIGDREAIRKQHHERRNPAVDGETRVRVVQTYHHRDAEESDEGELVLVEEVVQENPNGEEDPEHSLPHFFSLQGKKNISGGHFCGKG